MAWPRPCRSKTRWYRHDNTAADPTVVSAGRRARPGRACTCKVIFCFLFVGGAAQQQEPRWPLSPCACVCVLPRKSGQHHPGPSHAGQDQCRQHDYHLLRIRLHNIQQGRELQPPNPSATGPRPSRAVRPPCISSTSAPERRTPRAWRAAPPRHPLRLLHCHLRWGGWTAASGSETPRPAPVPGRQLPGGC